MPPLAVVLNIHPKFFVCSVEQAHNVHTRRVSGPRESQMTHHPQHVPKSLRPIAESHHSWVQPRPIDMSGGLGLFPCYLLVRVLPRRTYLSLDGPGRVASDRSCSEPAQSAVHATSGSWRRNLRAYSALLERAVLLSHLLRDSTRNVRRECSDAMCSTSPYDVC
jgi:hypothetical protein